MSLFSCSGRGFLKNKSPEKARRLNGKRIRFSFNPIGSKYFSSGGIAKLNLNKSNCNNQSVTKFQSANRLTNLSSKNKPQYVSNNFDSVGKNLISVEVNFDTVEKNYHIVGANFSSVVPNFNIVGKISYSVGKIFNIVGKIFEFVGSNFHSVGVNFHSVGSIFCIVDQNSNIIYPKSFNFSENSNIYNNIQ